MQKIVITGASSGLGAALAVAYAAPDVALYLSGRNALRLEAVAVRCRELGAQVYPAVVDVTNADAMAGWLNPIQEKHGAFTLVIANAGISGGTASGLEPAAQTTAIFSANVQGVANTLAPVLPVMEQAGCGQVAIISSLAGFRGLPGSPAYCASKGAVRLYGEGLRGLLKSSGVQVNVVCPGYVRTPMTDVNDFTMPWVMDAAKAAQIIKAGLAKNKARIAFPWRLYAIVWLLMVLPVGWIDALVARLPRKKMLDGNGKQ